MSNIELQKKYMNIMAELLLVMDDSPIHIMAYDSVEDDQLLPKETAEAFEAAIQSSLDEAVGLLQKLTDDIKNSSEPVRYVHAFLLICLMDAHITYDADNSPGRVSLVSLFTEGRSGEKYIGSLNDNFRETGILINPKYDTADGYYYAGDKKVRRKISNRDVFYKMNCVLCNCRYTRWDESIVYRNIVVPYDKTDKNDEDAFKVAFSPISGFHDPLVLSYPDITENGLKQRGIALEGHKQENVISERFSKSWLKACEEGAELFLGPEMMGSARMYEEEDGYLKYMQKLSVKARKAGLTPPEITIMPGLWRDGISRTVVVNGDGMILGDQIRHVQFLDRADHVVEAISPVNPREFCIIHIPGLYRIGILICAEFLPRDGNDSVERLCRDLGCNLILVPSFSAGEYDYMSALPITKPYGTSVIWGNCCGANRYSPNIIGGLSVAGTDYVGRMGSYCKCANSCKEETGCLFMLRLPVATLMGKPDSMRMDNAIEHILYKMRNQKGQVKYE